jgi:hypothetical protein
MFKSVKTLNYFSNVNIEALSTNLQFYIILGWPAVNFINVKRVNFSYEHHFSSYIDEIDTWPAFSIFNLRLSFEKSTIALLCYTGSNLNQTEKKGGSNCFQVLTLQCLSFYQTIVNQWRPYTLLVNARLAFISRYVWYMCLPNSPAVLVSIYCIASVTADLQQSIETEQDRKLDTVKSGFTRR